MLRIWFNRTYATNAHVIRMLRENPDRRAIRVIGTHTDPDSPVLAACDEVAAEPLPDGTTPGGAGANTDHGPSPATRLHADAYVRWALEFARTRHVDVFVPRAHMAELADARAQFAALGTRLVCADGDVVRLFADKALAYQAAAKLGLPVPPYRVVRDSAGLRAAHGQLSAFSEQVVMKPTVGAGGAGYRVLTTGPQSFADFEGEIRHRADLDAVCNAMDAAHASGVDVPPRLLSPYLSGREISVDVLADRAGAVLAAIGRAHLGRRRQLVDDRAARAIVTALVGTFRVAYLSNVQVRYWQGPQDEAPRPYLLELNTRVSGGLFQTALSGVNLPWNAVRLALDEPVARLAPRFGAAYTTISAMVPLGDGPVSSLESSHQIEIM